MKNTMKFIMFLSFCITLNACSGGGNNSNPPINNNESQGPDNRNTTPTENANVDACKEKLHLTIVKNGISRDATLSEIAAQGYLISKKCGFSEEELELYLKKQGY